MSRFHTSTVFLILAVLAAWFSLEGQVRLLALGLLLGSYLLIFGMGLSVLRLNFFVKATCRGERGGMRVALTFDDGPDPAATPELLKVLARHRIKAAFFPVGAKAEFYQDIIKQIDQQGHVLGTHSYRHAWWTNLLMGGPLEQEIVRARKVIEAATGQVPAFFRPPVGLTNPHLPAVLRKHGLLVVGWDVRTFDTRADTGTVVKRVLRKVRDGSIILLHDGGRASDVLVRLVDHLAGELRERGYTFAGLEEITGLVAYQKPGSALPRSSFSVATAWRASARNGRPKRLRRFLALLLYSTSYVKEAIAEKASLEAFKERPEPRFLAGLGLVLFSYVLGWPMVGLFGFLAAYLRAPALLLLGPVFYGLSHLMWLLGMYLAGRECMKYADVMLRWILRRAVERGLDENQDFLKQGDSSVRGARTSRNRIS